MRGTPCSRSGIPKKKNKEEKELPDERGKKLPLGFPKSGAIKHDLRDTLEGGSKLNLTKTIRGWSHNSRAKDRNQRMEESQRMP